VNLVLTARGPVLHGRLLIPLVLLTTPMIALGRPATEPAAFLLGADISALASLERQGVTFRDVDGRPDDAIAIFARHGWNAFRLRLFVNPNGRGGVVNSLEYTRALAARVKAAGATFMLDLHYSDTWADPQHQVKPTAWTALDFPAMEQRVEDYTRDVLADLKRHDVLPEVVQIGNEITGGTLWPDAQLRVPPSQVKVFDDEVRPIEPPAPYDEARQWERLARIVKAGVRGVRAGTTDADGVRIMIHIDCGGDWPVTRWFFDHLEAHGVPYDVIGQSYYPQWHGTLDNVRDTLAQTARRYGKDIVVIETAYPWKDVNRWAAKPHMAWPVSPQGQRAFLGDLIRAVRETPDERGLGVVYWHPESVPPPAGRGRAWHGGAMALFDQDGQALPGIDVLRWLHGGADVGGNGATTRPRVEIEVQRPHPATQTTTPAR